jgi:hypothetical protein
MIVSSLVACSGVIADGNDIEEKRTTPIIILEGYNVDILDAYAVTKVTRILENPNEEPMNHTFVFRIPEGALISNFSIEVDDVIYYADVLEKEEAEEAYQEAVASGKSAGLVASKGDQVFEYKVSFAPQEVMTATLVYEQILLKQSGWHEYLLPFDYETYTDNVQWFEVTVDIQASQDIMELSTTGFDEMSEELVAGPNAHWEVRLSDIMPWNDTVIRWRTGNSPPAGTMFYGEWNGSGYFLHVYDPDPAIFGDVELGKDFVFILDRSGSMSGEKFGKSKEALEHIYGTLGTEDRFSLVLFDSYVQRYSDTLLSVTDESVSSVLEFIRILETRGSTDIHSGVISALDIFKEDGNSVPVIVLLSDGQANTGVYHRSTFRNDVMNKNSVDASIFNIAMGRGADWNFLEALALENHGRAIWVMEDQDMVASITDFVKGFSNPLVSDLIFDYGPDAYDIYPRKVRAHYSGAEVLVAGRLTNGITDIPMMLNATTASGSQFIEQAFPIEVLPVHDFVPRFWAFSRIRDLTDQMKYAGPDDATIEEITDLAVEFHFVTDYTSLFVELPDEIKERFENSSAPYLGDPASSDDYSVGLKSMGSISHSTSGGWTDISSTTNSAPPSTMNDPATSLPPSSTPSSNPGDQDGDGSSDGSSTNRATSPSGSQQGTASRTVDLDCDSLPDIEENYPSYLKQGDQIILASEQEKGAGTLSEVTIDEEADGATMAALVVPLAIIMIPLVTMIIVTLHWYTIGHKRFPKR